jgi:hypothetical protein
MPWRSIAGVGVQLHAFLTSALDKHEITPKERAPGTHWTGEWVGPRAVLDAVVKRKIPSPRRKSNPRTPIVQPVTQRYTDWAIYSRKLKITSLGWALVTWRSYQVLWKSFSWFKVIKGEAMWWIHGQVDMRILSILWLIKHHAMKADSYYRR